MSRLAPLIALIAVSASPAQQTVHGIEATSGERFRTLEGITVVIADIQAPALDDDGTVVSFGGARARVALDTLIKDQALTLELEGDRRLPDGEVLAHVRSEDGRLLAQTLLEQGAVRLCLEEGAMKDAAILRDAQARAQAAKGGVWARSPLPPPAEPRTYRGISLGLYAQSPDFDYSNVLDEIHDVGASHIAISSPRLMDDWHSTDFWPVAGRSASWPLIERVTRGARSRGLAVAYHPMILLRTGTVEHWRGDIAPARRWLWFRNYARFIGQWADLANDLGVSLLMVGAEFASLERETASWRAVIGNVRSRFNGKLTYSANWDHFDGVAFWDDLDLVGITGFFSLTKKNDPTVAELAAGWATARERVLTFQATVNKPLLITEIGYCSQDGTNTDPWNYFMHFERGRNRKTEPDHGEQADCFQAFFQAWEDAPARFKGVYIWNWWRHEDPRNDFGFSVFGKPAYDVIRRAYADLARRETELPPEPK